MIPSGTTGAWLSLTAGNGVDVAATSTNARWNPAEFTAGTPPGESLAADPANAARFCWSTGSLNSSSEAQRYIFQFQNSAISANAQINERPSDLWIEFEMYMAWTRVGSFGTDQWVFALLVDNSNREMRFRNHGTTSTSLGNGTTSIGTTTTSVDTFWPTGQWRTVRLHYTASSNPGTTVNGVIQWYSAVGSHLNGDTLSFTNDLAVVGAPSHFGGPLASISFGGQNVNAYTASPCNVYIRNFFWTTTDPGSMTGATPWFQYPRIQIGQITKSSTAGKSKARLWYHYDRNQYGNEFTGIEIIFQVKKASQSWAQATSLTAQTADSSTDYIVAVTADQLDPLTEYDVRATLDIDSTGTPQFTTPESHFRTLSVPNGNPGTFVILSGSCQQGYNTHTPHSGYDVMTAENPDMFWQLGDIEYLDAEGGYGSGSAPSVYVAIGTSAVRLANSSRLFDRTVTSCQWEKLASSCSTTVIWDDHDVKDAWGGASTTPVDYTTGDGKTLLDETEAVWNQWFNSRTFVTNNAVTDTTNTVHYSAVETARCLFVHFDDRRFSDRSATLLGATQLAWAVNLMETTERPLVFLVSPGPFQTSLEGDDNWGTAWGQSELDDILTAAEDNDNIERVILVSADRHYAAVTPDYYGTAGSYSKVEADWCVSPLNQIARAVTSDDATLPARALFTSAFGKNGTTQIARGYLKIIVNEAAGSVTMRVMNGETGSVLYTQTYAGLSSFPTRSARVRSMDRVPRV